jgi:uncharacterized membrane protein YhaH (DUF805 family)
MKWYLKVLKQYADFSGRARRKEYWMFVLFNVIFAVLALGIDAVLMMNGIAKVQVCYLTYLMAMILPSLAVLVRRLHDTGRSGWWMLISLIPLVGGIWLLVLILEDSQSGGNRYGANPKTSPGKPDAKARLFSASVTMMIAAVVWVVNWCIWMFLRFSFLFDPNLLDFNIGVEDIFMNISSLVRGLLLLFVGIWLYSRNSSGHLSAAGICRKAAAAMTVVAALGVLVSLWYIVQNLTDEHYIVFNLIYNSGSLLMHVSFLFFAVALLWSNRKLIRTASVVLTIAAGIMILVNAVCNMEWTTSLTDGDPLRVLNTYMSFLPIYPVSLIALAGVLLSNGAGQDTAVPQPESYPPYTGTTGPDICKPATGKQSEPESSSIRHNSFQMPSSARHPDWFLSEDVQTKMIRPIKSTWYVDCKVYTLSDSDSAAIESQYPRDTVCKTIGGQRIPYMLEMSSNAIFTHEYGAFLDFGYVKFLYRNRIYYANVAPMVKLTHDLYDRHDLLCHLAKILIVLLPKINDRKNMLLTLDGDLKQDA